MHGSALERWRGGTVGPKGNAVATAAGHPAGPARAVCLSEDGAWAYSGGDDGTVRCWAVGAAAAASVAATAGGFGGGFGGGFDGGFDGPGDGVGIPWGVEGCRVRVPDGQLRGSR